MASNRRPQATKSRGKKTSPYRPEKRIKAVGGSRTPKYRGQWDD